MTVFIRSPYLDIVTAILMEENMITGKEPVHAEGQTIAFSFQSDKHIWTWLKWLDAAKGCCLINYGEIERD